MGKGKCERGGRADRHSGGREGRKPNSPFHSTLDTEMFDVPHQRSERYKQNQNKSARFETHRVNSGWGGVGKADRDVSEKQPSIFSQGLLNSIPRSRQLSTRAGPPASGVCSPTHFVNGSATKSRRASIGTCISALSTHVGRGLYCYKCARTNRKLRQALFELLERALKDGRKLIDEWAWEAGVSPDHMDCERSKMHIIPGGLRSDNELCHRCKDDVLSCEQSQGTSKWPPWTSQAPDMSGPQLPAARIQQPVFSSQPQQKLNPFIQAVPDAFMRQPSSMLASQTPYASPWAVPNATTVEEQTAATCARYVEHLDQASQLRQQQKSYQEQEQGLNSSRVWQVTNRPTDDPTDQRLDQNYQQPAVHQVAACPAIGSHILNFVNQETHCVDPYMYARTTTRGEEPPHVQMSQAPQHPFQHLQDPLEHPDTVSSNATAPPHHEEDWQHIPVVVGQSLQETVPNALITPPPSDAMTVRGMLNAASEARSAQVDDISVVVSASDEDTHQGTGEEPYEPLDPSPAQGQQSQHASSKQKQVLAQKYVRSDHLHLRLSPQPDSPLFFLGCCLVGVGETSPHSPLCRAVQ